jgi:hypothetical protein
MWTMQDPTLSLLVRLCGLCTTRMQFLRRTRRFSTAPRNPQDVVVVVVVVVVAVAVAGVIPLVAAVRLRCAPVKEGSP